MSVIINVRGSDALQAGSAKAPTDSGLVTGNPALKDATGREHLEARELAVNTNPVDPCIFLRTSDDKLAKFRPTSGLTLVDTESKLPAVTPGAAPLHDGDTFLVRFAPDGTTPLNRLVVFDQAMNGGAGGWNWGIEPRTFVRNLVSDPGALPSGTAKQHLERGDLQVTLEPGKTILEAWDGGKWVTVFGTEAFEQAHPSLKWLARASDLPNPAVAPIPDGAQFLVRLDLGGLPLDRLFVWRELTAPAAGIPQTGEWHVVDPTTWVKNAAAALDNTTDAKPGDLTITTEKDHESIKVFANGAWTEIPATSTEQVKKWIASLSLFEGTVQEVGGAIAGAVQLNTLPNLLSTTPADVATNLGRAGHYWIFVGNDKTVVAGDPNGLGRDLAGAVLRSGEWILIANRGTTAAPDLHYVHVPSDLLTYSRSINLYGHENWRPGAWEQNSLVVYKGSLWRAVQGTTTADGPPTSQGAVAQVETLTVNAPAALPAGSVFTATINGAACTYTTAAANEPQATVRDRLLAAIKAKGEVDNLLKVDAGVVAGEIVLTARNPGLPFTATVTANMTAVETTANVRPSPWLKVEIGGGLRHVPTIAELPAAAPREELYFVLSHSDAGGKGALTFYDSAARKWEILGGAGGGKGLELTGGELMLSIGCPIGSVMAWLAPTAPKGWLIADGSPLDPAVYPELAKVLATNPQIPAGHLPDLRGAFLRGAGQSAAGWGDASRLAGSSQDDSTRKPRTDFTTTANASLNTRLTVNGTTNTTGSHVHDFNRRATKGTTDMIKWGTLSQGGDTNVEWWSNGPAGMIAAGDHAHTVSAAAVGVVAGRVDGSVNGGGDAETRGVNVACWWIIKALDTAVTLRP